MKNLLNTTRFGLLVTILFFVIGLTSCQKDKTSVTVRINGISQKNCEVKLYRQYFDRTVQVAKKKISGKSGKISFNVKGITEPSFYQVQIIDDTPRTVVLIIENGEKVNLSVNLSKFSEYQISGSEGSIKAKLLTNRLDKTIFTLDSLYNLLNNNSHDIERRNKLKEEVAEAIEAQREFSTKFIWENPLSCASVMALYQQFGKDLYVFDRPEDIQLFKMVASSLRALYPESDYTKGMLRDIANQKNTLAHFKLLQLIENSESTLPEISLPNPKGDTVRLSSLKGKVILLDFWASTNQESLFENRELIDIYKKYRSKGFEIFQVSLDTNRDLWISAIERTGIPWISVCELNPYGSMVAKTYNIPSIPFNYLIDKDFNIVGKFLYGPNLESKLKEIL